MTDSPGFPLTDIASVRDGTGATVRGTIKRTGERMLRAPLSDRPCVYWEVNQALGSDTPTELEGVAFWLEDATGRVLVRANELDVAARAERRTQAIALVDANIVHVSQRIQEIKRERRNAGGPRASKLHAEHQYLKRLATLLCAVAAHARGNLHVGTTLKKQEAYIRKQSPDFAGDDGNAPALTVMRERYEVILEEGAEVEVRGLCMLEPVPPGMGHGGGYRDAPTCLHMRAPAGGQLYVRGLGDTAPISKSGGPESAAPDSAPPDSDRPDRDQPERDETAQSVERRGWLRRVFGWLTG